MQGVHEMFWMFQNLNLISFIVKWYSIACEQTLEKRWEWRNSLQSWLLSRSIIGSPIDRNGAMRVLKTSSSPGGSEELKWHRPGRPFPVAGICDIYRVKTSQWGNNWRPQWIFYKAISSSPTSYCKMKYFWTHYAKIQASSMILMWEDHGEIILNKSLEYLDLRLYRTKPTTNYERIGGRDGRGGGGQGELNSSKGCQILWKALL